MAASDVIRDRLLAVIAFILVVAALKFAYPVVMPIVVAAFIIAVAWPIKPWLEQVLPSSLSSAGTVLILLAIIAGFAAIIYFLLLEVALTFTQNQGQFRQLYEKLTSLAQQHGLLVNGGFGGFDRLVSMGEILLSRVYTILGYFGVIAVLVILGLPEVPALAARLREQLRKGESREVVDAVEQIAGKFRRYIAMTVLTSIITGVASAVWGYTIGLDLALIWGVLNFLLNFIPIVGNIIGIIPPTLYAFIQFESWTMTLIVFAGFAVLQVVISNFIYPMLQGRSMAMSGVLIIAALLFWSWLWGVAGALLAVPLTAALIITCQHFKSTATIASLLGRGE